MATEPHNSDPDDRLASELAAFFARTDPVPAIVTESARAAIEFRDLDGQIAELLRDSALEDKELAGVRGVGQRLLSFGAGQRFIEVDVAESGDRRDLTGYVVPAAPGRLFAEGPLGVVEAEVDDRGRFRLERVSRGPCRLRLQVANLPAILTPWLAL